MLMVEANLRRTLRPLKLDGQSRTRRLVHLTRHDRHLVHLAKVVEVAMLFAVAHDLEAVTLQSRHCVQLVLARTVDVPPWHQESF